MKKKNNVIKVLIMTNRFGGPFQWAKEFKEYVENNDLPLEIKLKSTLPKLLKSPFHIGKFDIVHSTIPITFRLWNQPLLLNIRGDYKSEFNKRNPWALMYPKAIKKADKITVPSKYLKKKLGLKTADIIPNCLDPQKYPVKKNYSLGKKVKLITVTSFAYKDKAEGVLEVIRRLAEISINKNVEFSVLAGGIYFDYIKLEAKKIILPTNIKVKFEGKVNNVKERLLKADVFVYYSVHDNFPNSVLQAMACGLPVITNNIGAIPEMIKDKKEGLVVEGKKYSEAINTLLKSEVERKKLGTNATKKVSIRFTWKNVAESYYTIYKNLVN